MSIAALITCSSLHAVGATLMGRMCIPARHRQPVRAH
jgi:hypothetical protein